MLKMIIYRLLKLPIPTWGVWIPAAGWARSQRGVYSTHDRTQARQLSRWVEGEVHYIDDCLIDMEQQLLSAERLAAKE